MNKDLRKEINRTIRRAAFGLKGTGRRHTRAEIRYILNHYRKYTESVTADMEWEDYLNLIDIAVYVNPNNAVDLSYRLGYMDGEKNVKNKIEEYFRKGGVNNG